MDALGPTRFIREVEEASTAQDLGSNQLTLFHTGQLYLTFFSENDKRIAGLSWFGAFCNACYGRYPLDFVEAALAGSSAVESLKVKDKFAYTLAPFTMHALGVDGAIVKLYAYLTSPLGRPLARTYGFVPAVKFFGSAADFAILLANASQTATMGVLAITLRARERFAAVNHEAFFSFISTARVCSASVLLGRPGSTNYDILLGDLDVPSMVRIPSRY